MSTLKQLFQEQNDRVNLQFCSPKKPDECLSSFEMKQDCQQEDYSILRINISLFDTVCSSSPLRMGVEISTQRFSSVEPPLGA